MPAITVSHKNRATAACQYILLGGCVSFIGIFYILTLSEGHKWGGDFALYIAHAKNIAFGLNYGETGYIPNPFAPDYSPVVYPPVFPLLLSPVYRVFGMDIHAMKVAVISSMLCMLVVFLFYARRSLRNGLSVYLCLFAVGLSPWLWQFRDSVLSEFPFMLFLFSSLLLAERAIVCDGAPHDWRWLLRAIAAGLCIYLAYGTRTVGGVLIPAVVCFDLLRHKRLSSATWVIVVTFVVLFFIQNQFISSEKAYSGIISLYTRDVILRNFLGYSRSMAGYWASSGIRESFAHLVFLLTSILFTIGWITSLARKSSIGSIFLGLYVIVLLVAPISGGRRYLLPIIPLYLLYVFAGSEVLAGWLKVKQDLIVTLILAGVIFAIYAFWYKDHYRDTIIDGPYSRSSLELFTFVKEHTGNESIFIFRKPRVLALYTGRKASPPSDPGFESTLWEHINSIGATHVIIKHAGSRLTDEHSQQEWVEDNRKYLQIMFENDQFRLYRILK